jgi:hypothetical protein
MGNIFLEYAPVIYMDKLEPFKIKKVGVASYTEDGCGSRSFNRIFDFNDFEGTTTVLEYAYYLDYDIQHLYDLEHIWVYLDKNGNVIGAEGSYHGRFLNAFNNEFTRFYEKHRSEEFITPGKGRARMIYPRGSRIIMYSQPGKHAFLSDPRLMNLYTRLYDSCDRLAGIGGLEAPEKFLTDIKISEEENAKVAKYIKDNFSFVPSMEFEECEISSDDYMDWDQLEKEISSYLKEQLEIIRRT